MEMCRIEHWDTRTLDAKIDAQLYERTAISRKPKDIIKQEIACRKTATSHSYSSRTFYRTKFKPKITERKENINLIFTIAFAIYERHSISYQQ